MRKKRKYTIVNEKLGNKYTPKQIDGSTNLYRELSDDLSVEITGNWKNSFYVVIYDSESELIIDSEEYNSMDDLVNDIEFFEKIVLRQHELNKELGKTFDKQMIVFDQTIRELIKNDVHHKYHQEYYREKQNKLENNELEITQEEFEYYKNNRHQFKMAMEYLKEKGVFDEVEIG